MATTVESSRPALVNDAGAFVAPANYGNGFRARVGYWPAVRASALDRVSSRFRGTGVSEGLSTGSRANDLCIDAGDANTVIPESKACLCRLEKL